MDLQAFERVYDSFCGFHAHFAPLFGRRECRDRGRDYLQGLLVQTEERRNAENMAEVLPVSARVLQRFLTESPWNDPAVVGELQAYLGPRLAHPRAVWAVDSSGFPKQGTQSVGVARQYCGALGKVANCQIGVFLAHVGPCGRALVDKRLYLPKEWTDAPKRCDAAGVPKEQQLYRSEAELALEMLQQAQAWGHLAAAWVTGDDTFGKSPEFRDGVAAAGFHYVLEIPPETPVWPLEPTYETPPYKGKGPRPAPRPVAAERQEVHERAQRLPEEAWQAITVAEGTQGLRTYRFAAERVRETRESQPGRVLWLVYRKNLDGSEPRFYFSNAPEETELETLAWVAAARWPIETEFETEKSDVGLDEYEVRSWAGWHHHITMCLLASAFLLSMQQEWGGKRCRASPVPKSIEWCANCSRGSASAGRTCSGGWKTLSSATSERAGRMPNAAPPGALCLTVEIRRCNTNHHSSEAASAFPQRHPPVAKPTHALTTRCWPSRSAPRPVGPRR
jgi:SRSO17 transposase